MTKDLTPEAVIERMARGMAAHSGWDAWDTATSPQHTPNGNEPDEERAYWRELAQVARAALSTQASPADTMAGDAAAEDIHSCHAYCERPACVQARDGQAVAGLPPLPPSFDEIETTEGVGFSPFVPVYTADQMRAYALAAQKLASDWVSVEDRLPEERTNAYLVATIARKTYADGSNYPGMGIRAVAQDWNVRNYASNYTHWMTLPAAPSSPAPTSPILKGEQE